MMKFHPCSDFDGLSGKLITECKNKVDEVSVYLLNTGVDKSERNYVNIKNIYSNPQRQGYGTKGMYLLCLAADKYNVTLVLKPEYGENNSWLRKFYSKFGFRCCNVNEMKRLPRNRKKNNYII